MTVTPTVLCILDGFGYREDSADNAIKLAKTPTYDRWWTTKPRSWLKTSGLAVGLPEGQMGNSEVGHMNLGSGRVVMQDLPKINAALESGALRDHPRLADLITNSRAGTGTVHLMGLVSPGGVHSHQDHMLGLAEILTDAGLSVDIHAFLDGRDTPPQSAAGYIDTFDSALPSGARIATLVGRYYAMDRDKRWDRVEKAYRLIIDGTGTGFTSAREAVDASYAEGVTDEFMLPAKCEGFTGIADGDSLIMANFRADRAREILTALVDPDFDGLERDRLIGFADQIGMVDYSSALSPYLDSLFPAEEIQQSLGETVAEHGLKQLRIAETEKYAHVTFFFNGGSEDVYDGEDRILIPSPDVATYDLKPEMSAHEVTDALVDAIRSGIYSSITVNYANPDMVGHTGVLSAAIQAVETIDACLARLEDAVTEAGGVMLVTADHGNVELMTDPDTGAPHTAHTDFDVPIVMVGAADRTDGRTLADGSLQDVAPTVLALMGVDQPALMTGQSLVLDSEQSAQTESRAAS